MKSFSIPLVSIIRVLKNIYQRNDVSRWREVRVSEPPWDERNQIIAKLIPDNTSVLDIGSGAQTLRKYLASGVRYQPCDLIAGDGVLFCDFNSGIYPDIQQPFDFVICSGSMEYARRPEDFIERVSGFGKTLILSYISRSDKESKWSRLRAGWLNHLTEQELEALFFRKGLQWSILGEWGRQKIYRLNRG